MRGESDDEEWEVVEEAAWVSRYVKECKPGGARARGMWCAGGARDDDEPVREYFPQGYIENPSMNDFF